MQEHRYSAGYKSIVEAATLYCCRDYQSLGPIPVNKQLGLTGICNFSVLGTKEGSVNKPMYDGQDRSTQSKPIINQANLVHCHLPAPSGDPAIRKAFQEPFYIEGCERKADLSWKRKQKKRETAEERKTRTGQEGVCELE